MSLHKPVIRTVTCPDSSNVEKIRFFQATSILHVFFKNRDKSRIEYYEYQNVTQEVFNQLIVAESVGRALYQHITCKEHRDSFPYKKIIRKLTGAAAK